MAAAVSTGTRPYSRFVDAASITAQPPDVAATGGDDSLAISPVGGTPGGRVVWGHVGAAWLRRSAAAVVGRAGDGEWGR
jgi:hypothetical protein